MKNNEAIPRLEVLYTCCMIHGFGYEIDSNLMLLNEAGGARKIAKNRGWQGKNEILTLRQRNLR